MATPSEINNVFTTRQLSYYKVDRDLRAGDLALIHYKDDPSVYNDYSDASHTYMVYVKEIILNKEGYEHLTTYKLDVYCEGYERSCSIVRWMISYIVPVEITDEIYQKAKNKLERKAAREKKLAEEREEQRRHDEEQMRILRENLRKQEEEERQAKIRKEEERRAEPLTITVGMWEDLMGQLSVLQEMVSDLGGSVRGLRNHCYGYGMEE